MHEKRKEKVLEIQKKRREERRKRREAGEEGVEEDSGGEGEDPILHEIMVRRKKWLEEQKGKGEAEEVKGPFKKRRARRRERKMEKAAEDEGESDSDSDEEGVDGGELMGGVDLLGSMMEGGWGDLGKVVEKWKKQRRVVAFVGGLDLCDGRWDDQVGLLDAQACASGLLFYCVVFLFLFSSPSLPIEPLVVPYPPTRTQK